MATSRRKTAGLRTTPVQPRGTATVERILDAALEVLHKQGLEAFNTNVVAAMAGVNIATLYHYFPDKISILRELFLREETERLTYLRTMIQQYPGATRIDLWVSEVVNTLTKMRRENLEVSVLRNALRVVPELQELEDQQDSATAEELSIAIRRRHDSVSRNRALAIARLLIHTGVSILDRSSGPEVGSRGIEKELSAMFSAYLGSLDGRRKR